MSSLTQTTTRVTYEGDDTTTTFVTTFWIRNEGDIVVALTDTDGTVTNLSLDLDYTVDLDITSYDFGSTVDLIDDAGDPLPLATGQVLTIYRAPPLSQQTDFSNSGSIDPVTLTRALDYLMTTVQYTQDEIERSIRFDLSPANGDELLPLSGSATYRSGKTIVFDSNGDPQLADPTDASGEAVTATGTTVPRTLSERFTDPYNVRDMGAVGDNFTNDLTAIQATFTLAQTGAGDNGVRGVVLGRSDDAYRTDGVLTIDRSLTSSFNGQGGCLNFEHKLSGACGIVLDTSTQDIAETVMQNNAHELRNLIIRMPSYTDNAAGVGLTITDLTASGGNYASPAHRIDGVSIRGGAVGVKFGPGSFNQVITGLQIEHAAGNTLGRAIHAPTPWTDGGECPKLIGGGIYSAQTAAIEVDVGSMNIDQFSIDGCAVIGKLNNEGELKFTGVYAEFTDGGKSTRFLANDNNAIVSVYNTTIGCRDDLAIQDTVPLWGGIGRNILRNVVFRGSTATQWYKANGGYLMDDASIPYVSGLVYKSCGVPPLPHVNLNFIAYPNVDNANAADDFTISHVGTGVNPAIVTKSDGVTSYTAWEFDVATAGVSGDKSKLLFTQDVSTMIGADISVVGRALSNNLTASNISFKIIVTFQTRASNTISATTEVVNSANSFPTWLPFLTGSFKVPRGTKNMTVSLELTASGATSGDHKAWITKLGIGPSAGFGF